MDTPRVPGAGFARGSDRSLGNDKSELLATAAAVGKSRSTAFKLTDFTAITRWALRGFGTVETPSGLVFHDVAIFCSPNGEWSASPPAKPLMGSAGPLRDKMGKVRYTPVISFASKQHRDRWSTAVISALKDERPELFS